jgi:hypothetical protein
MIEFVSTVMIELVHTRIWEVFFSMWGQVYTNAEQAAEHEASNLEAPLNSTHSLLNDQIVMHESL